MSDHIQAKLNQWDYLIVTASNDAQAQAYESQLKIRQELGFLSDVCQVMVVADPGGKRIGSGGSTLYCLMQVLQRRLGKDVKKAGVDVWEKLLGELRILIIHAGGDSRRLPAYGPCGKIFVPVPGEYDGAINLSLFDRQLPIFLALPEPVEEIGQVVITSGDILLRFDPASVQLATEGVTGLACYALPKQASRHGVFCIEEKNKVRQYLQKPSIEEQKEKGAIDLYGQACLDIGVMNFDAATAVKLLGVFGVKPTAEGQLAWSGKLGDAIVDCGLDFYREICCAMGSDADMGHHLKSARGSGSKWSQELLSQLFDVCSGIPFNVQLLKHCDFLDFGANRSVINSGMRLLQEDRGASSLHTCLDINNQMLEG
ncbi:MAG: fucose pyrophosphorylase domain-containing protein, partial [Planctomycetota bacterium]